MKQIIILFWVALLAGCAQSPTSSDLYTLTVELNNPYNRKFKMETVVVRNEPFELTKLNGRIKNTLSGVLRDPEDGKFPLELTVSEWESDKSNSRWTIELNLELGEEWSGGIVQSLFYEKTITLSKSNIEQLN